MKLTQQAQREQMFASHLTQTVHLVNPEYPKVFTNFENQVGEYSIAYKKAKRDFKIISKIQKNKLNYDLIVQYAGTGEYDVIHYRRAEHITEEYGYGKIDCLADRSEGDTVREGEYIYKTPNYDDAGNFGYGVNLKAAYLCWKGLTYEDAVVISKSAAKKLTSYKVEESMVSVNTNDVLLNLYDNGEYNIYHSFPHVGERTLDNVLVASRREDNQTMLYSFQYDKMKRILPSDDITYTNGGIVADMDIYCNMPIETLKKRNNQFTQEIVGVLEEQEAYYRKAAEELDKIVPPATEAETIAVMTPEEKAAYYAERKEYGYNWARPVPRKTLAERGVRYTDEFGAFWKKVHEYIDHRIQWRTKGKAFQNFKIKFTILKENPLQVGSKITGRYGNKGVVAKIEHDEAMPMTEDGTRAEIVLNSLGVLNRMNPAQIIEQHINFMSDHVLKQIKAAEDVADKIDIYLSYLKYLDKEQYDYFSDAIALMTREQKESLMTEIEEKGIYVHEAPFFKNTAFETYKRIYREHPEWCARYKCTFDDGESPDGKPSAMERPIVIGDIYFIRLKHEASNKTSYVSDDTTNNKNQPSKSNMKKNHKTLFQNTPVRLGRLSLAEYKLHKSGEVCSQIIRRLRIVYR